MPKGHIPPETGLPDPVPPEIPGDPARAWPRLRRVGTRVGTRDYLGQVWERREFLITVPMGEFRARNQDQVLGQLWYLLNPLLLIAVYYLIFGVLLERSLEGRRGVDAYLPFLIVGIIVFNYTRSSVQAGARTMTKNLKLMQSMNFPRAILPLSALASEVFTYLVSLPVMLVLVMLADGGPRPMWTWLLLIPIVVIQTLFNLGALMIVSRLTFHFRDVQQFLPYAMRLLFYASGVLLPINADLIPNDAVRTVLLLNPAYYIVEMARGAVLYGEVVPRVWTISIVSALVAVLVGFYYFRGAEHEYSNG